MKIYEVTDESIETKAGLTKDQKDAIAGRGKYKPKQDRQPRKPSLTKDYTTRAPRNYNMPITSNDPTGAMSRA